LPETGSILEIGKGRIIAEGSKVALLAYGGRLGETMKAAELLEAQGLSTTVADARFAKPLDTELVERLAREHEVLITVEEGSMCGFGAIVLHHLSAIGALDNGLKIRTMTLPDVFQDQDSPMAMYDFARLNAPHIVETVRHALGITAEVVNLRG